MELQKIIIALDSFKGSLTSLQAAKACEQGIRHIFPSCNIITLPLADGGEGTLEALVYATKGRYVTSIVHDPLMRPVKAAYGISGDGKTTFIELAQASGLVLLKPEEQNPMKTTTYGTGELIRTAIENGSRNFLMGIGGSATNDAGTGLLQALGFRFFDAENRPVHGCGENLQKIVRIDTQEVMPELAACRFHITCDVTNPLAGPMGAAYVYAPQKGATPEMVGLLDNGLRHFAGIVERECRCNISTIKGAGAAGGTGGTLAAFFHATLDSGIRLLLDALHIAKYASDADLIITGEGKIDRQSFMGKTLQGIVAFGRANNIPVIAIAGKVEQIPASLKSGIREIYAITPSGMPLPQAMRPETAMRNITATARQIMQRIKTSR